jgi:two-component system sensor histidine kinase/response regulator
MGESLEADEALVHRPHILIVEDDELQQEVLGSALRQKGCEVKTTVDGLDAVWEILAGSFDLVLLDYNLPEIDGLATARIVHDLMGDVARPKLIGLTGNADRLRKMEGVPGSAFDEIIAKPDDLADLLTRIDQHLNSLSDPMKRRAAESSLLLQNWERYETDPEGTRWTDGQPIFPRILVVEDDELQQLILRSALETRGYIVETASDGLQAARMMRGGIYDLVLVDYQLPGMDGLAVARLSVNLMGENRRPPMIALTAAAERLNFRQQATGNYFDEIVTKSLDLDRVLVIVDAHLLSSLTKARRRAGRIPVAR